MEYNKNFTKSNGRVLVASGPRASQDRQKRQQELENINTLLQVQIDALKNGAISKKTDEDIDTLINKEVDKVINELTLKYKTEIETLKSIIKEKDVIIASKNDLIGVLRGVNNEEKQKDNMRPVIDTPFIAPIEDDVVYESHINNKEENADVFDVSGAISKLKSLGIKR